MARRSSLVVLKQSDISNVRSIAQAIRKWVSNASNIMEQVERQIIVRDELYSIVLTAPLPQTIHDDVQSLSRCRTDVACVLPSTVQRVRARWEKTLRDSGRITALSVWHISLSDDHVGVLSSVQMSNYGRHLCTCPLYHSFITVVPFFDVWIQTPCNADGEEEARAERRSHCCVWRKQPPIQC